MTLANRTTLTFLGALVFGAIVILIVGNRFLSSDVVNSMAVEVDRSNLRRVGRAEDGPCDYLRPKNRKLGADEAVRLAECFIEMNGYTDKPPIADKSKLTPENVYPGTDEFGMTLRKNSLESKAYGYWESDLYGGGWEVAFRHIRDADTVSFYGESIDNIARCVWMDPHVEEIIVMHSNCFLSVPGFHKISNDEK